MPEDTQHTFVVPAGDAEIQVVTGEDGSPWFILNDLCGVLGIIHPRTVAERIPAQHLRKVPVQTAGGEQMLNAVDEPGLNLVVLRSRAPGAERFQLWIAEEVLPALRRTGSYHMMPATMAQALRAHADTLEALETQQRATDRAQRAVAAITPSAGAWDNMAAGRGTWTSNYAIRILKRDPALKRLTSEEYRAALFRVGITSWDAARRVFTVNPRAIGVGNAAGSDTDIRITPRGLALVHRDLGGSAPLDLRDPGPDLDGEVLAVSDRPA